MASSIDNIELQEHAGYTSLIHPQESSEAEKNIYAKCTPLDTSSNIQEYVSYEKPSFPNTGAAMADTELAVTENLTTKNKVRKNWKKQAIKWWLGGIVGAAFVALCIASIAANIVLITALYNKIPWAQCDETGCPSATNELVGNSTTEQLTIVTLASLTNIAETLADIKMSNNETISKILTRMDQLAQEVTMKLQESNKLVETAQEGYKDIQHFITTNIQALLLNVLQNNTATLAFLTNITDTLTDTEISNNKSFSTILIRMEELLVKNELISNLICPVSCQDIQNYHPISPSGYYSINGRLVYCEMGELCGSEGGWTRLAYLNISDPSEECPSAFQTIQNNQIKACGRPTSDSASCASVRFLSHGISYSEVCGRVVGYQYGSTDAVDGTQNIDSNYMDGISITHGYSPRKHVWTLYAGLSEAPNDSPHNCPCNTSQSTPSFVGNDYFCESGNPDNTSENKLYTDDPLWDGKGCGSNEGSCCLAPGLPWFHKTLNTTTTDYLELRSCGDFSTEHENTFFSICELFVK